MTKRKPDDRPRYFDWTCIGCGWHYHSDIALLHPPSHRCKPNIPRSRTLTPLETP